MPSPSPSSPPPTADALFPTHITPTGERITALERAALSEGTAVRSRGRAVRGAGERVERAMPATLQILPWPDPVIDRLGIDARSPYVEQFWLGLIGPASVLLLRHLAARFDARPDGFELDLAHAARVLGLGTGLGRWAPMQRTVHRCVGFGFARTWGSDRLLVRRRVQPVTRAQLARLPEDVQRDHDRWRRAVAAAPPGRPPRD